MRRLGRWLAVIAALSAAEARAWDPLELVGATARGSGLASAMTAGAADASGAFYNPAGVALAPDPQLALGWTYTHLGLRLDGQDAHLKDPRGFSLALALPLRLGRVTAAFGLGLYLPDQYILRIQLVPPSEPHFGLLDNDPQRIVSNLMLALSWRFLALGVGVSFLSDAAGRGITFDVGLSGGEKVGRASLDYGLPTRVTPIAGIVITPAEWVRLGLSYRGAIDLRLSFDVLANVDVAGVVTGDAVITIRATNFFTPKKLALGAELKLRDDLRALADVVYYRWSEMSGGAPDLRVLVNLGVSPPLVSALFPPDGYHDTVSVRGGLEYVRAFAGRRALRIRGGLAFEPSPVPDQHGLTSVADNDRLVGALGVGVDLADRFGILRKPFSLAAAFQLHHLFERTTLKSDVALGPGFTSGGNIYAATLTATGRF